MSAPQVDIAASKSDLEKVAQESQKHLGDSEKHAQDATERHDSIHERLRSSISVHPERLKEGQLYSLNDVDPALDAKIRLVNKTIDEIGWTGWQLKLFFLNGFGYAADSLILLLQSITATQAAKEFHPSFSTGLTAAAYVGMLVGALFWGFSADIIGRKYAFNVSLFICSVFAIVAGASPNWIVLGLFTCLAAFGAGGNLVLDSTLFLEFLPGKYQWVITVMACWWGLAPVIGAAFAWPLFSIPRFYCESASDCPRSINMGWRYIWFGNGALVLICSILRVTIIKIKETPKYLLTKGEDEEVIKLFDYISTKYKRPISLTLEELQACGQIRSTYGKSRYGFSELGAHLKGLFQTKLLGLSTVLIWFSWLLIGLAYPLFYAFLPQYLSSRGADTGDSSTYDTWRNYMITNTVSIFGPVLAGFMCNIKFLGRRYTMIIGALLSMCFFFAYTAVRTRAQNLAFSCCIYFVVNIYYGTLYAYTPEVLPSAHRATGYGVAIALNRVMGMVSAFVAAYGNTATSVPIYVCAALYIVMAIVAWAMPFEPYGKRSM